jgi:hypothetical protein
MQALRVWATLAVAVLGCFDAEETGQRKKVPAGFESAMEVVQQTGSNWIGGVDPGKRDRSRSREHG